MKTWIRRRDAFLKAIAALFFFVVSVASAMSEEEKPTVDFSMSSLTKYVWRGQEMTKNSIVIQPSLTVGYRGFSSNLWGKLDTNPYAAAGKSYSSTWTETDFTFAYNKTFGPVTAGLG